MLRNAFKGTEVLKDNKLAENKIVICIYTDKGPVAIPIEINTNTNENIGAYS